MADKPNVFDQFCERVAPSKVALSIATVHETIGSAIEEKLKTAPEEDKNTLEDMMGLARLTARILRWQVREMRRVLALALIETACVVATGLWLALRAL